MDVESRTSNDNSVSTLNLEHVQDKDTSNDSYDISTAHTIDKDSWQQVGLMLVTGFNCGWIFSFSNLIMVPLGWTWGVILLFVVGFYTAYANWLLANAPNDCDEKDHLRWMNCLNRDFTINGLMLDPYARVVYDYMGGIEDIRKAKVRTIIPADMSFREDCARILRAIRVTARLGFSISKETAHFVKLLSSSVARLNKGRLLMEIDYMLAYGSGEASLRLLWKFGLLDILLPFQAAYFTHHGFRRRDKRTNMLLSLFSNLDKLLAPNRPCHSSLWCGILALHKALSDRPRDPLVVAAFSLAVYNGGNVLEAVKIARMINKPHDMKFPELLDLSGNVEPLEAGVRDLAESVRGALLQMTDEHFVSQAMADYPQAPHSDLVFIPLALYVKAFSIFECVKRSYDKKSLSKQDMKIDYESLANGNIQEIRHVFARIVFDTVFPLHQDQDQSLQSSRVSH